MEYKIDPLPDGLADKTIQAYICSQCWGHLVKFPAPNRLWWVVCAECGEETIGYVTKAFVERRQAESFGDKAEAKMALRDAIPWLRTPKRESAEILKELGF